MVDKFNYYSVFVMYILNLDIRCMFCFWCILWFRCGFVLIGFGCCCFFLNRLYVKENNDYVLFKCVWLIKLWKRIIKEVLNIKSDFNFLDVLWGL